MTTITLLSGMCLSAQNFNNVKPIEFEAGFGIHKGAKYNDAKADIGLMLFIEFRRNMNDSPFDVGSQLSLSAIDRKSTANYPYDNHITMRTWTTFFDYNYRKWKRVSLFGGLGFGCSWVENAPTATMPGQYHTSTLSGNLFVLNPRIGAEFFNRVRLTLDYKMMTKEYSFLSLNIGFVIGGGPKIGNYRLSI